MHPWIQTDSGRQTITENIYLILNRGKSKLQILKLKFITGNITFESGSLTIRGLHIFDQQACLLDIFFVNDLLIVELKQIQIVA